jgi:hypothetical protein
LYGGAYDFEVILRFFKKFTPLLGRSVIVYSVEVKYGWSVMNMHLLADNDDGGDGDNNNNNRNHNNNKKTKRKINLIVAFWLLTSCSNEV